MMAWFGPPQPGAARNIGGVGYEARSVHTVKLPKLKPTA
jgi:hypothetical protein